MDKECGLKVMFGFPHSCAIFTSLYMGHGKGRKDSLFLFPPLVAIKVIVSI